CMTRSKWSLRTLSAPTSARSAASASSLSVDRGSSTSPRATGGRGRAATPTVSARKRSAPGVRSGACAGSPQPHQRIAGGSRPSATYPLQAVERLLERGAGGTAHEKGAKAGKEPGQRLAKLDRHARPLPGLLEPDARLRRAEEARERRPRQPLAPPQRVRALVALDELVVGTDEFPPRGPHHLRERALLHVLHVVHARPPPGQMVRIADQQPQLLHRRGDRTAATHGRHDRRG